MRGDMGKRRPAWSALRQADIFAFFGNTRKIPNDQAKICVVNKAIAPKKESIDLQGGVWYHPPASRVTVGRLR